MTKQNEIATEIRKTYGSAFINQRQAAEFLGMGKQKARQFLATLPVYRTGKEKKYNAGDIAKLMEKVRTYENYG